jgi:hypothetical protein
LADISDIRVNTLFENLPMAQKILMITLFYIEWTRNQSDWKKQGQGRGNIFPLHILNRTIQKENCE